MSESTKSKYWLHRLAADCIERYGSNEIIVSSGHSPSGNYTVGSLREIVTASAIVWSIRRAGGKARHLDFSDDYDVLRKIPVDVDQAWQQYQGQPLYTVPDPWDCHPSYGAHYTAALDESLAIADIEVERIYAHDTYPAGIYTKAIEQALGNLALIRSVISDVSKRTLPEDWAPVQVLSDNGNLRDWKYSGWDKSRQVVTYTDKDGAAGQVSYTAGRVKLDWRLDWPARWAIWGVQVEPFGRDHAAKGGSYDTGKRLVREVFKAEEPFPVPYDFINPSGETKKMSKSAGGVVTAMDALTIMPPEILRFFMLRSLPAHTLVFDEGLGLYNLIDEYSKVEQAVKAGIPTDFADAYQVAAGQTGMQTISSVPFSHLVAVYQAAQGRSEMVMDILGRTGFEAQVKAEHDVIVRELAFVANWLTKYAPDSVKFSVQPVVPAVELSDAQGTFLTALADAVAAAGQPLDGQGMHEAIYMAKEKAGLAPADAFRTLYQVILGKDSGPKAGWFLSTLNQAWLVSRLRLTI